MSYLRITKYPEKILRIKAQKVEEVNSEIQKLVDDMIETMKQADGVGLAAPQVGVPLRVIIVNTPEGALHMINPEIVELSEEKITEEEGCLSVPGFFFKIPRSKKMKVRGLSYEGKTIEVDVEDLGARIFQHEVDHLNGKLVLDRIGIMRKLKILPEVRRREKEGWK